MFLSGKKPARVFVHALRVLEKKKLETHYWLREIIKLRL